MSNSYIQRVMPDSRRRSHLFCLALANDERASARKVLIE